MSETMTLQFPADPPQFIAKMNGRKERFVRLCLKFESAQTLADELTELGVDTSERTASNWRSRQFKRLPYNAVQGVKYLIEAKKLERAQDWADALREAQSL